MNIGFIINEDKDKDFVYTKKMIEFCLDKNIVPTMPIDKKSVINCNNVCYLEEDDFFKNVDFIVILGGDGTILRWSKKIAKYNKDILGINIGNLGYLTDVEKQDGFSAIEKVLKGDYKVEKRMMISVFIDGKEYICLNEFNVNNGKLSRMVKIAMEINGRYVDALSADGLIISTPTGSTAYNLSAGGPILKPDTHLMAITYVCPHALFSRPYVISGDDEIKVYLANKDSKAYVSLDGQESLTIEYGQEIYIKKSNFYTNIIKTNSLNFYDVLRRKMVETRK